MNDEKYLAWHVLGPDRCTGYGENIPVYPGLRLQVKDANLIDVCNYGYHGCKYALDALHYRKAGYLCRVMLMGRTLSEDDKWAAEARECLWMVGEREIRRIGDEFTLECVHIANNLCLNEMDDALKREMRLSIDVLNNFTFDDIDGAAMRMKARDRLSDYYRFSKYPRMVLATVQILTKALMGNPSQYEWLQNTAMLTAEVKCLTNPAYLALSSDENTGYEKRLDMQYAERENLKRILDYLFLTLDPKRPPAAPPAPFPIE